MHRRVRFRSHVETGGFRMVRSGIHPMRPENHSSFSCSLGAVSKAVFAQDLPLPGRNSKVRKAKTFPNARVAGHQPVLPCLRRGRITQHWQQSRLQWQLASVLDRSC